MAFIDAGAGGLFLCILGLLAVICFTSWLLHKYSNRRKTSWHVSGLVWFGWFFSFSIVFFIPLDVASGRHKACDAAFSNSTAGDVPSTSPQEAIEYYYEPNNNNNNNNAERSNNYNYNNNETPLQPRSNNSATSGNTTGTSTVPATVSTTGSSVPPTQDTTSREQKCGIPIIQFEAFGLGIVWNTLYWTVYILCWAVYPMLQSYVLAAHFHPRERCIQALKENGLLYGLLALGGVILIIWAWAKQRMGAQEMIAIAMALGNVYGLSLLIILLSYGLVELPKKLWRRSNRKVQLSYLQFQATTMLDDLEKAQLELDTTLRLVRKYHESIEPRDRFRPYMDTIIKKCPPQFAETLDGEGEFELNYKRLVKLHGRVINADMAYTRARCLYEQLLKRAFELEDIIESVNNPQKFVKWSFKKRESKDPWMIVLYKLEWVWKCFVAPRVIQLASICAALLSISIVWSETVFWIPGVKLSIFYWFLNGGSNSLNRTMVWEWIIVFFPVLYISYCAYWSFSD